MPYPKRLIEVDLPIKRISEHARREKSIRHGHISTLHIWWARRPLAACRAVICASIWPDPADELCPLSFKEAAFRIMKSYAREAMNTRNVRDELLSEYSLGRLIAVNEEDSNFSLDNPNALSVLRQLLLDFIADFANWNASNDQLFLKTARELTQAAHEALGGEPGTRPMVVDPFAGGGSIPLEALRVGADSFASDLNPVAVLLNKVVLEYIPKYGQKLADEVRKWGQWVKKQAEKELAEFYPKDPDGAMPIAYLWARTIISDAPGEAVPVEVPLMRSLWLSKVSGRKRALRWVRDTSGKVQTETIDVTYADGKTVRIRRPMMEIFTPKRDSEVEAGTVARGSATCPVSGFTTPVARVREQLTKRYGGAIDARLFCVVTTKPEQAGRNYRLPIEKDLEALQAATREIHRREKENQDELALVPREPLPIMSGVFNAPIYGHSTWGSLFSIRQSLSISSLTTILKTIKPENVNDGLFMPLKTCLALVIDKLADKSTSLCGWKSTAEYMGGHTFGRQALPMFWDYCEANIFGGATGDFSSELDWVIEVISHCSQMATEGAASEIANAMNHPLPNDSAQYYFTDPPYYNAVPYADLSDFFYIWLRRTLRKEHPKLFNNELSPKAEECCEMAGWDPVRYPHKDGIWFESQMSKAMSEGRRVLVPNGVGIVVFAHKSTGGWEAMLKAMVDAGWVITGSWPIDTEMGSRLRAMNSAVLASSIHIACRPRENPDGSLRTDDIGDWRDVLNELPGRIHEWMPRLAQEGVVGADAIFSCLGPALEIFSRYSSVEKSSGEKVELKEYLEHVWAAVAREALNMIFEGADASGFEEDARLTAMWLWTLRTSLDNGHGKTEISEDEDEEETDKKAKGISGYSLEYDAARKIAQGLGAHLERLDHLVQIKGETATLLSVAARTRYLFGKDATEAPRPQRKKTPQLSFDFVKEIEEVEKDAGALAADITTRPGATVLDQVHQSMILFGAGRTEALKRLLVDEGVGRNPLFWRLAQSLSALYPSSSEEKRWIDGVSGRKKGLGL